MIDTTLLSEGVLADLTTCDREPIHTPGSIQPHGALVVADAQSLRISHVSANLSAQLLGHTVTEVLGSLTSDALMAALREESHGLGRIFSAKLPAMEGLEWDVVAHRLGERIYLEFESPAADGDNAAILAKGQAIIQSLRRTRSR